MTQQPDALIAIVEDDAAIAHIIADVLDEYGFRSTQFRNARDFESSLKRQKPDLCLVDLGLPDQNGLDLVKALATRHHIASIIISGRKGVTDKIVGLEMGADDYLAKPFEAPELVARVRTVLRRTQNQQQALPTRRARFDKWVIDLDQFTLQHDKGNLEQLSKAEMDVMQIFLNRPNRLLSRAQILDFLDGDADQNFDRSVDVRISRLRTKLKEDPQNPKLIKTIYGAGYLFVAEVKWE